MNTYYVYILASKKNWILYIWVTNNLVRRIFEHKEWIIEWFTKKYFIKNLVYYETCSDINAAIKKEKQLKKWNRQWKIELIEKNNPDWKDLYDDIIN